MDRPHRNTPARDRIGHACETEEACWPVDFASGTRWFEDREIAEDLNSRIPGGVRIAPKPAPRPRSKQWIHIRGLSCVVPPPLPRLLSWL